MTDLISRQEAIDAINALHEKPNAWLDSAVDAVMTLPAVESVRHGKWIKADSQQYFRKHYPYFTCSECGYRKDSQKKWNYCLQCGARMDKE